MSTAEIVRAIFAEPWQWGLRGDPLLWKELSHYSLSAGLPETAEEFLRSIVCKIRELVGSELRGDQGIYIERYNSGGMSSGYIDPKWWRETGIPLLGQRFQALAEGDGSCPVV